MNKIPNPQSTWTSYLWNNWSTQHYLAPFIRDLKALYKGRYYPLCLQKKYHDYVAVWIPFYVYMARSIPNAGNPKKNFQSLCTYSSCYSTASQYKQTNMTFLTVDKFNNDCKIAKKFVLHFFRNHKREFNVQFPSHCTSLT